MWVVTSCFIALRRLTTGLFLYGVSEFVGSLRLVQLPQQCIKTYVRLTGLLKLLFRISACLVLFICDGLATCPKCTPPNAQWIRETDPSPGTTLQGQAVNSKWNNKCVVVSIYVHLLLCICAIKYFSSKQQLSTLSQTVNSHNLVHRNLQ